MWDSFGIFMNLGWIQAELFPLPAQLHYFFHCPRLGSELHIEVIYISSWASWEFHWAKQAPAFSLNQVPIALSSPNTNPGHTHNPPEWVQFIKAGFSALRNLVSSSSNRKTSKIIPLFALHPPYKRTPRAFVLPQMKKSEFMIYPTYIPLPHIQIPWAQIIKTMKKKFNSCWINGAEGL